MTYAQTVFVLSDVNNNNNHFFIGTYIIDETPISEIEENMSVWRIKMLILRIRGCALRIIIIIIFRKHT